MKVNKKIVYLFVFSLVLLILPDYAQAYRLNGDKISSPKKAYYWIDPDFKKYKLHGEVKRGVTAWNPSSKIEFLGEARMAGGARVKIEYLDRKPGDYYGIYNGRGNISLNKRWRTELKSLTRKETAVHEVGHALGLAHTQAKNNLNSVMRAREFNYIDKPMSDDYAGINKIYK